MGSLSTTDAIYVYGICLASAPAPTLPLGLEGETALVQVDAIAAIIEPGLDLVGIQSDNPRLLRAVLSHDRVLCDLFQQMTILPLRFGTQLASLAQLQDHLAQHQEIYRAKLVSLGTQAEYQLKLLPQEITPAPLAEGLKGRDYFLAKKQRLHELTTAQQQQQAELQALLQEITALYADCIVADPVDTETKVYLLVDRHHAEQLGQRVELWQGQAPHWQVLLSEALPPYHFV